MATNLSGGAIDRLGDRLRETSVVGESDLVVLQQLRREFDGAMAIARERLVMALPDARPTTRLKTVQTLVAKLQREPTMQLSRVQDVAGMRLVVDMALSQQDELVQRILDVFPEARVVDRRLKPSFGYRAVHVVPRVEGRLIEIQVRTTLQDRWAQIVERMADHWGRLIRYGAAPDHPGALVGRYTRAGVVELARRLSPLIEQCEKSPAVRGRRVQTSSGVFCAEVSKLLATFGRLNITSEGR